MTLKTLALTGVAVAAVGLVGCGDTATNTANTRNANGVTNLGTNNANVGAVVVNNNTNMASNRWANTNITRDEYDRNRADYERDRGDSTIGTGVNDSWLWFKTRAALLTTDDLRESTVSVDVANDVVTLRGSVETAAQKSRAEQVAKGVDGVKSVRNQLTVSPDGATGNTNNR